MALQVKISAFVSQDRTSLYFFDKTGIYHVTNNPTGYGTPNPATTDFTTATITIRLAGATVDETPINIFTSSFPNSDVLSAYEVTAASLGITEFPTGLTRITYNITGTFSASNIAYAPTKLFLVDGEYCCCIANKKADIANNPPSSCSCETDTRIADMLYAEAMLAATQWATCCGDTISAAAGIVILDKLCGDCGC